MARRMKLNVERQSRNMSEIERVRTDQSATMKLLVKSVRPSDIPLAIMKMPPVDSADRENLGQQVWTGLCLRFESELSEQDVKLWRNPPQPDEKISGDHLRLMNAFDAFLLERVRDLGWRLMMSAGFIQRLAVWEMHSPHLLKRLGNELELKSKIYRGEAKAPINLSKQFIDGISEDLDRLLTRMRTRFGARRLPSCADLALAMKAEIETQAPQFPWLYAERGQLHQYVEELNLRNPDDAYRLRSGDMRGREFFKKWYATSTHRKAGALRQALWEQGSRH